MSTIKANRFENTASTDGGIDIDSSGKVGIGTSAPSQELHVKGAGTVATFEGTGGSGFIGLTDSDDSTTAFIGCDGGSLKFQTSGSSFSDKLVIDQSGNISAAGSVTATNTCKAWVNFEADGTVGILNSFNVSSIDDGGTGIFTINFTNALASANYTMTGGAHTYSTDFTGIVVSLDARSGGGSSITTKTTSACAIVTAASTTDTDPVNVSVVFFE
tara:strand:+ start:930 stop:1577 length:648 start_codon:yes stop_codon:yes gene_type:complete